MEVKTNKITLFNMTFNLKGKTCLVTGANKGVGRGIMEGFKNRSAEIIATDIEEPDCHASITAAWDVTDYQQGEKLFDRIEKQFGHLDVVVANAGIYPREKWENIGVSQWKDTLDVNLNGTWNAIKLAAIAMSKQGYGKIITVSSIEVAYGVATHPHYNASKAGIIGLTRSMARALGKSGIRVNCIMLGAIRTEGEIEAFDKSKDLDDMINQNQSINGRLDPHDVEPTFAFLSSEASDAITGQVINVDNGWVMW